MTALGAAMCAKEITAQDRGKAAAQQGTASDRSRVGDNKGQQHDRQPRRRHRSVNQHGPPARAVARIVGRAPR
eukprot:2111139-Pleurochrysis_carterae.AAC.1